MANANPYYGVLVCFEPFEMRLRLSKLDNIKPAWAKKLKAMAFPEMEGNVLTKSVDASAKDIVLVDQKSWLSHYFYDGNLTPKYNLRISAPREDGLNFSGGPAAASDPKGQFEITYSPSDKSILLKLSGTFDCGLQHEEMKLTVFRNAKFLYFNRFLLKDAKGKNITVNNEDGVTFPLEAYSDINEDKEIYQVPVKILLEKFVSK